MRIAKIYIGLLLITMVLASGCKNESKKEASAQADTATADIPLPASISYQLIAQYPHDPKAFTEGLQYVDGYLYESVGEYGKSDIRKVELTTGKVLQQQAISAQYFGEGLTVLNDKIYQLTYKEHTGFVYDKKTMKQIGTFSYNTGEGWGLTNDGSSLIYSDGTSYIYYLDPATFKEQKRVQVTDNYGPVSNINELEYIKGYIYANQWLTNLILKIDPATGKVLAQANVEGLRSQGNIQSDATDAAAPDVLNGIAYDAANNRIFVTGKNWPKLFEIKLDN